MEAETQRMRKEVKEKVRLVQHAKCPWESRDIQAETSIRTVGASAPGEECHTMGTPKVLVGLRT